MHKTLLQKILPAETDVRYPLCIDGKFAAPPEDNGGPPGYCDLLEALKGRSHEEHADARDWLGADICPEYCDIEEINIRLRRIKV